MSKEMELTSADLFAGAGGLTVGFHQAGFRSVFFNEIDETFAKTFKQNFSDAAPFVCPIEELNAKRVIKLTGNKSKNIDVMVGGPPCQGYSINAPIRSTSDPRNHLFRHYIRLVLEGLRPKFVVLENVPGLVSFENGNTLRSVKAAFENAGYRVAFGILNAAHYGVPEERWRLVFIGTRLKNVIPSLPKPKHYSLQRANFSGGKQYTFSYAIGRKPSQPQLISDSLKSPITIKEAIDDLPPIPSGGGAQEMAYQRKPNSDYQKLLRKKSKAIYNHECSGISKVNFERIQYVKPGGSWRDIPHDMLPNGLKRARRSDHTKRYGRLKPDGLSGTILTKCDPHWGTFIHYNQDRIISVREAARIQSFPDWFKFIGPKVEQYKQVGNAVPPLLAQAIAEHIKVLMNLSTKK